MADAIAFTDIVREARRLVEARLAQVGIAFVCGVSLNLVIDLTVAPHSPNWAVGLAAFAMAVLTIWLTNSLLGAAAHASGPRPDARYPEALLLDIVMIVGTLAGLLLLVVPGLILFVRWSVALPTLIAERIGPVAALRRSWDLTRDDWFAAVQVLAVGTLVAAPSLYLYWSYPADAPLPLPAAALANLLHGISFMVDCVLLTALYLRLRRRADPAR